MHTNEDTVEIHSTPAEKIALWFFYLYLFILIILLQYLQDGTFLFKHLFSEKENQQQQFDEEKK